MDDIDLEEITRRSILRFGQAMGKTVSLDVLRSLAITESPGRVVVDEIDTGTVVRAMSDRLSGSDATVMDSSVTCMSFRNYPQYRKEPLMYAFDNVPIVGERKVRHIPNKKSRRKMTKASKKRNRRH